jgi:hypothetical protein
MSHATEVPLQGFHTLVRVRNEVVYYKMEFGTPKFVSELTQRGIALSFEPPPGWAEVPTAWAVALSSTEGIRWAHNTACSIVGELSRLAPESETEFDGRRLSRFGSFTEYRSVGSMAETLAMNFTPMTDAEIARLFAALDRGADQVERPARDPRCGPLYFESTKN